MMANTSHGHVLSQGHFGSQLGFSAPSSLTTKNMSFASGSVSPRKEPRGRKRRTKLSQMLAGDTNASSSSTSASGLASNRLPPLSGHFHSQLQTKIEAALVGGSSLFSVKPPRGVHDAPQKAVGGPLLQESPLGLTLKKTPSLLDLISNTLGSRPSEGWGLHGDSGPLTPVVQGRPSRSIDSSLGMPAPSEGQGPADKLKASNFAALSAQIGTWERHSRYEGDLVAKCYFAKKKLVWEVLEQGLKSKIEVQWGDIRRIKADCSETQPGVLEIEISKAPMFFHELNPQPRKHTIWSSASDFTGGQATIARKHVLTFPAGILEPHYKKLLLCDSRLRALAAGLPEPVAMRPPAYQKLQLQVPRPCGGVLPMPAPRPPLGAQDLPSTVGPSGTPSWTGLVNNLQRVLLQERPGSPRSVIGRGDRPFSEESGSSEDTSHLIPPADVGFVDANFARDSAGDEQDEMMLDSPFTPGAEGAFTPLDFAPSPTAGLFSEMPYDLPSGPLLVGTEMEGMVGLETCPAEGSFGTREKEVADRLSSSQPQGVSVFSEGGRLRKYGGSGTVPSLGSEMSAFHVVGAGPKALRSVYGRLPPGPSPLDHLDSRMGSQATLPGFGLPASTPDPGRGAAPATAWREDQNSMVEF